MGALPHIYPVGATFFITFRLVDSLPQDIFQSIKTEYFEKVRKINKQESDKKLREVMIYKLKKEIFGKYDRQLDDKQYGDCHLSDAKVARILWDKIFEYNEKYYTVEALAIMPNHVHILLDTSVQLPQNSEIDIAPEGYVDVPKWIQLIKGGSSFQINKYLGRKGALWHKESFDHFVRYHKDGELGRIKNYTLENSVKANLDVRFLSPPYWYCRK